MFLTYVCRCVLAHLSRNLKWACLIKICQLSVFVVNFSHFHFLLQNHWIYFNQTWHKPSIAEQNSSLFKWRVSSFSRGRWYWNSKNTLTKFMKIFFWEPLSQFQPNLTQCILGLRDSSLFKWRAPPFPRRDDKEITKFKNLHLQKKLGQFQPNFAQCIIG